VWEGARVAEGAGPPWAKPGRKPNRKMAFFILLSGNAYEQYTKADLREV
jgi:hypothetical protein